MQEFFELKLGNMTMEEYVKRFLDLMRYVDCIKDEKIKIQRFLSGLPFSYKDQIQYDEPKNLEEAIRKAKHLYEQSKGRTNFRKSWKDKKQDIQEQRKKGSKPPPFRGNTFQPRQGIANDQKASEPAGRKNREPIECWTCGGDHLQRFCPQQRKSAMTAHNIQEETVEDVARGTPRIYAALDNRQADHQANMIEIGGMINKQTISILIDSGASHSYIDPSLIERLHLTRNKHDHPWMVQLATGTKRKVSELVKRCPLEMNGLITMADLNIIPLGSYHVLIGMDWLESHHAILDCYNKTFTCLNDEGQQVLIEGIPRPVSLRQITALQLKKCLRKGCQLYVAHVEDTTAKDKSSDISDFPLLQEFADVFQEVPCLPPKRDIDFSIDFVPGAILISKTPYKMGTP